MTDKTALKSTLRKTLRQARNALSDDHQRSAAEGLLKQLQSLSAYRSVKHVAMYLANDGEISPEYVMQDLQSNGQKTYLPLIVQNDKNSLLFAEVTEETRYTPNRYGILEPSIQSDELITAAELDLVLLPLVGFDLDGNRIGMGGGFYDTTFEFVKEQTVRKPEMLGLAHECQRVEHIDAEQWDIPLGTIVTDKQCYQTDKAR